MEGKFAFVFSVTEHERGWGQSPAGYLLFIDQKTGEDWVKTTYASRDSRNVPDCYYSYDSIGYRPISEKLHERIFQDSEGFIWVKHLEQ